MPKTNKFSSNKKKLSKSKIKKRSRKVSIKGGSSNNELGVDINNLLILPTIKEVKKVFFYLYEDLEKKINVKTTIKDIIFNNEGKLKEPITPELAYTLLGKPHKCCYAQKDAGLCSYISSEVIERLSDNDSSNSEQQSCHTDYYDSICKKSIEKARGRGVKKSEYIHEDC